LQQYKYRKTVLIFLLASVVTMLTAATGCGGGTASASSGPAPTPTPTATPDAAHVSVNPATLDFGSVAIGSRQTINLTVTNSRGSAATVTQISVTGTGFSFTSTSKVPFQLPAGQSAIVAISFAPTAAGRATGSASVTISGGASPAPTSLIGSGLASGQLGLTPASMNFGNVTVGSKASQSGSLTAGATSITVSSASWNGAGYALSGITFPVTVPAGQSVPFTVTFTPQVPGTSTGNVSFVSNASNSPGSESLTGAGVAQHSVALSWNASTSTVVGYNVYRSTQTGGPYARVNSSLQPGTTFSDGNVVAGTTYFYVVTAVDSSSQESSFSNEAKAPVPTP
jgi:Abnormal spindle-like microcephaly-assoc'd, ASPM-SPD-2-Hydin